MPQPYTIEQQKAIALAKARKRKQASMAGPGPEVGPVSETVQMPFTVQQMPLDARRDWMEANAPNAVTQPQREKTGIGEAATLGILDMGGPAATAPAGALGADVDADMTAALQDRPVSFRLGQGLALGVGPGAAGWKLGEKAMTKASSVISPAVGATSKSVGSKAARYLGRGVGLGILGLAENFGFNTLAEGRNQNRLDTGESQGVGDVERGLEVAADDALNPVAALAPAATSGIFRAGKYVKSGGQTFTPDAVAARVDQALTPSSGQVLPATLVGAIDPAAEKQLVRLLHNEGGFSRDDITAALIAFEKSVQSGGQGASLPSRLKDVLAEQLGERARKPIDDFLQGAGNRKGGESGRIVGEAVAEDAPRLSQFLEDSANSRFGSANRYDTLQAAQQEMARIGQEGYEAVFRNQPTNAAGVESLKEAAQFFAGSELSKPLRQIAAGKMMDLDQMIQTDPRRAAHWMQHTANLKAQQAADAGDTVAANAYRDMRQQLLSRLEADGVAPGYKQARKEFGDEFSNAAALNFGDRFVSVAEDPMKLGKLLKEMEGMTPTERDAALLSIRDAVLKPAMRRTEGGLPRMAIIGREPVLNALERLGPEGTAFANDVRKTAERVGRTQQIDPRTGSNTMNKQEAAAFAEKSVANPLVRAIGNTMQNMGGDAAISGATGVFSPIMTGRAMLRKGGDMLANGRQGKIDALTDLLARDMGSAPRSPMSGDPVPTSAPSGRKPVQQSNASSVNSFAPQQSPVRGAGFSGFGGGQRRSSDLANRGNALAYEDAVAQVESARNNLWTYAKQRYGVAVDEGGNDAVINRLASEANDPELTRRLQAYQGAIDNQLSLNRAGNVAGQRTTQLSRQAQEAQERLYAYAKAKGVPVDEGGNDGFLNDVVRRSGDPEFQRLLDDYQSAIQGQGRARGFMSGGLGSLGGGDAGNALVGGAIGGFVPADSTEDRLRNIAVGAGIATTGGRLDRMLPSRAANSAGAPRIRKDIPKGTPKQAGPSRMSGSIQRGLEESSSMGAAKATGDKAVRQKTAMSEASRMADAGRNYVDVFEKTGVVLIPYKGGTIKYYAPGADHPDTVIRTFIADLNKPLEKRQPMTNTILTAIGEQERPLMLGRQNTPMIEGTGRQSVLEQALMGNRR